MKPEEIDELEERADEGDQDAVLQLYEYYKTSGDAETAEYWQEKIRKEEQPVKEDAEKAAESLSMFDRQRIAYENGETENMIVSQLREECRNENPFAYLVFAELYADNESERIGYLENALKILEKKGQSPEYLYKVHIQLGDEYQKLSEDEKAFSHYINAAEINAGTEHFDRLARCCREGIGCSADPEAARKYEMEKASVSGPEAIFELLCEWYEEGLSDLGLTEQLQNLLHREDINDYPGIKAQCRGKLYALFKPIPGGRPAGTVMFSELMEDDTLSAAHSLLNDAEVVSIAMDAIAEGQPESFGAAEKLAHDYWKSRKYEDAIKLYEQICTKQKETLGEAGAKDLSERLYDKYLFLGDEYLDSAQIENDEHYKVKAFEEYKKAEEINAGTGHFDRLVRCYSEGIGCEKDLETAKKYEIEKAKNASPKEALRFFAELKDNNGSEEEVSSGLQLILNRPDVNEYPGVKLQCEALLFSLGAETVKPSELIAALVNNNSLAADSCLNKEDIAGIVKASISEGTFDYDSFTQNETAGIILNEAGKIYKADSSLEQNIKNAEACFEKAVSSGNKEASDNLDLLYREFQYTEPEKARKHFETRAAAGDQHAMFDLGNLYENNDSDYTNALYWYKKSAEQGNAEAGYRVGLMYENGTGTEQDLSKAVQYYESAAEAGSSDAMERLGLLYADVNGLPSGNNELFSADNGKAKEFFEKAADLNNSDALYSLGVMCMNGDDTVRDYNKAFECFNKISDTDNPTAKYYLGLLLSDPAYGTEQDTAKAFELFEAAANAGISDAAVRLADAYMSGSGVQKNYEKALEYYNTAEGLGNSDGTYGAATIYLNGNGVRQNYKKAFEKFSAAADQGNNKAVKTIGNMYENGLGVDKDLEHAIDSYNKAGAYEDADRVKQTAEKEQENLRKQAETRERNKKIRKYSIIGAAAAALIIISVVVYNLVMKKINTVNVFDNVAIEVSGVNGYGIPEVVYPDGTLPDKYIPEDAVTFKVDKTEHLSNGDQITITAEFDPEKTDNKWLSLSSDTLTYEVQGIPDPKAVDVFKEIEVTFSGVNGNGRVSVNTGSASDFVKALDISSSQETGLRNGDTVTVTVNATDNAINNFAQIPAELSKEYIVSDLGRYVTSLDDMGDTLNKIIDQCQQQIYQNGNTNKEMFKAYGFKLMSDTISTAIESVELKDIIFVNKGDEGNMLFLIYDSEGVCFLPASSIWSGDQYGSSAYIAYEIDNINKTTDDIVADDYSLKFDYSNAYNSFNDKTNFNSIRDRYVLQYEHIYNVEERTQ